MNGPSPREGTGMNPQVAPVHAQPRVPGRHGVRYCAAHRHPAQARGCQVRCVAACNARIKGIMLGVAPERKVNVRAAVGRCCRICVMHLASRAPELLPGLGAFVVRRWNPSNQNVVAAAARSDTAVQLFDLEYTQARSRFAQRGRLR